MKRVLNACEEGSDLYRELERLYSAAVAASTRTQSAIFSANDSPSPEELAHALADGCELEGDDGEDDSRLS